MGGRESLVLHVVLVCLSRFHSFELRVRMKFCLKGSAHAVLDPSPTSPLPIESCYC